MFTNNYKHFKIKVKNSVNNSLNKYGSNKKNNNIVGKSFIDELKKDTSENQTVLPSSDRYIIHYNRQNTLYSTPIILVDDEDDLLFTFKMLLKAEGYNNIKSFSNSRLCL